MKPKEIFIVSEATGQYDDYREDNLVATFDEEVAKAYISKLQKRTEIYNNIAQKICEFTIQWTKDNPDPDEEEKHNKYLVKFEKVLKGFLSKELRHIKKDKKLYRDIIIQTLEDNKDDSLLYIREHEVPRYHINTLKII